MALAYEVRELEDGWAIVLANDPGTVIQRKIKTEQKANMIARSMESDADEGADEWARGGSAYHRIIRLAAEPMHWITAAARRVAAGEDFDAVMQALARRYGLHSATAFESVKQELMTRVEQERAESGQQREA